MQIFPVDGPSGLSGWARGLRLFDTEGDEQHAHHSRHYRDPEHQAEVVTRCRHQCHGCKRPGESAHGVHRLAQPVGCAALFLRRDVGDQRIARCAAYALADAVEKARRKYRADSSGEREQWLGQRRQPIAQQHQRLATAEPVGEHPGEHLGDRSRGLGDAFDEAHRHCGRAQDGDQEHRQEAVDHLRGEIHGEAHQSERDDTFG